jgi:hypothetical protein
MRQNLLPIYVHHVVILCGWQNNTILHEIISCVAFYFSPGLHSFVTSSLFYVYSFGTRILQLRKVLQVLL